MNGEPGSLRGLSRGCAAPLQLGGRVCAPGAGRAGVRGSGPSLLLRVWVGVSASRVPVLVHLP